MGAPEFLITLLADGAGAGIQTVSTFIPVIACLFLFLSILEDSGYMARAAFIIDRAMNAIGLPGKSFVSLLTRTMILPAPKMNTLRRSQVRSNACLTKGR
jgi:ferrous iron transport protein B